MPRQRKNSSKPRKTFRRRRAQKSRLNRNTSSRISPVAQVIGKGIRSLVSILPGNSVITPIADFVLKAVGLSSDLTITDGYLKATASNIMLTAKLILTVGSLLRGTAFTTINGKFSLSSRYTHFRVKSFTITARPTNKMASRSGDWSMLLYPMSDIESETSFQTAAIPPEGEMSSAPYFKRCSALNPITITFTPRRTDGSLCNFLDQAEKYCGVIIQYEQVNRSSYESFTADEFAFDLDVVSNVEARLPTLGGGTTQYVNISERVIDCLSGVTQFVKHENDIYHIGTFTPGEHKDGFTILTPNFHLQGSDDHLALDMNVMAI